MESWRAFFDGEMTMTTILMDEIVIAFLNPLDAAAQLTTFVVRRLYHPAASVLLWQMRMITAAVMRRPT